MYFLKRLLGMIPMLLLISLLAFVLVRLAPGGPFDRDRVTAPEVERALKAKYHLDKPLWQQYWFYLTGLLQGDLGPSLKQRHHTVNDIVIQGLPISMAIGFSSFLFALGVGVPLGFFAAINKGGWKDWLGSFVAMICICVPALVLAPVFIMYFSIRLGLFPVGLLESPFHMVLPTITLGIYFSGRIARLMREGMLGVLKSEFIMAARAKGLSDLKVFWKHAFPMAVLPVVSYSGPLLADLLTGSFIVESLFQIPGIGVAMVNSSLARDYPVIVGLVVMYAFILLLLNLAVDFAYAWLDPRVRYE